MPTNAALASTLQRPLSALALVLQQPPSPVSPCSHHTATLVTDPAITALAAINRLAGLDRGTGTGPDRETVSIFGPDRTETFIAQAFINKLSYKLNR